MAKLCYSSRMEIIVVLHDIRSVYNVGAILRSCDGFGVREAIFSGYTPIYDDASLLLHLREKLNRRIEKTALGAEKTIRQKAVEDLGGFLDEKRENGYVVIGLENNLEDARLVRLRDIPKNYEKVILLLGEEVFGIPETLREKVDIFAEIPMLGEKESFNVSVAAGIALYELRR